MKKALPIILLFCCTAISAQNKAIEASNRFIESKKYESAFNILNSADPSDSIPEIAIAKTDLFLNYFVTSIMHHLFALTDLEPEEDILEIRGSEGSFSMFAFAPDSVLNRLIEQYPENFELRKSLGNYYHEVHLKYQGNWLETDSIVIERFFENYKSAFDHDVYDYWSAYGIGYACLVKQDYLSSIPYFQKSIELNNDYPTSYYNLAYAYLYTDQAEKGIVSAKAALDLYDLANLKADAAKMIGVMFRELENPDSALVYYRQADEFQSDDYYTLKPLLDLELALNEKTYPETSLQFFQIAPENPTIYQDLMSIYWSYDKPDELIAFLSSQHENYLDDPLVNGNLYFFEAVTQYEKNDMKIARKNFEKSREIFRKVYEPDHPVFEVIDSYTNEM